MSNATRWWHFYRRIRHCSASGCSSTQPDGFGKHLEGGYRGLPSDATIGDALAIRNGLTRHQILSSGNEMTFDHYADNTTVSPGNLFCNRAYHARLVVGMFSAVGVAGVDHDAGMQAMAQSLR
jgi:hypothetical protein